MEAIREQITLGEPICKKLKQMYFANRPWPECKQDLPKKFNQLKAIMRRAFPDKTEKEMLIELVRYNEEDIRDIL